MFGIVETADCKNVPAVDERCNDPAFALANPDICPTAPRLVIKPAVALVCQLRSIQFKATYIENGVETDVTDLSVFKTSNPNIAVVGAASGNATGLSAGDAAISATYNGATVFADLTVLGENCCSDQKVAMMVLLDRTKSFSQAFSPSYQTKLHYGKVAAKQFIEGVNEMKDVIGLIQFTETTNEVLSEPIADKAAVSALVDGISQTQQLTSYFDALTTAIASLNAITDADRRVIVLITEGEDSDTSYLDDENPIALLDDFKQGGGIVMCLGVRAHGRGYALLSNFATGGFFVNAHEDTEDISLEYLNGLKGYVCAGNCTPVGDVMAATGSLNYCGFDNWLVKEGHVDLIGNGFLDLLPSNGLYVDLAGSTAAYNGKLLLKEAIEVEAGKQYSVSLRMAGNQRVDASPNSVKLTVFERNTDGLEDPTLEATVGVATGSGVAAGEDYEYTYSYVNTYGETEVAPAAAGNNADLETFGIELSAPANANALTVRFWKRLAGTERWYLIAETDAADPQFTDTLNNAALEAAVAAGTIDACAIAQESNTTGTPIVLVQQTFTLNDFQQDFSSFSASFTASHDADVFISVQQTATPVGYDATGLLLDKVTMLNVTDGETLFEDDFDTENITYIPPACGIGSTLVDTGANEDIVILSGAGLAEANGTYEKVDDDQYNKVGGGFTLLFIPGDGNRWELFDEFTVVHYLCAQADFPVGPWETADPESEAPAPVGAYEAQVGYVTGTSCYGDGCLEEPPAVQSEDPNPLADIEQGYSPPQVFTSTRTACVSCPSGTANFGAEISKTLLSSTDSSPEELVNIFQLSASSVLSKYCVTAGQLQNFFPYSFELYGSNDNSTWTLLDEQIVPVWVAGQQKCFVLTNTTAWLYVKFVLTDWDAVNFPITPLFIMPVAVFGAAPTQVCETRTAESEVSQGAADAAALAAATAAAQAQLGCIAVYTSTQSYTAKCSDFDPNTYGVNVTKTRTYVSLVSQADADAKALALATAEAQAALDCTQSNNDQPIQFNNGTFASATPYPSVKFVEGLSGVVSKVTVTLKQAKIFGTHAVALVLRAPDGTAVMILNLNNLGGEANIVTQGDYTFDDDAVGFVPHTPSGIPAGSYKCTVESSGETEQLPAPAPTQPYGTVLADFDGIDPNGAWSLWAVRTQFNTIFDPATVRIYSGWDLAITTV